VHPTTDRTRAAPANRILTEEPLHEH
jgi:hypothetical protein